jgi:hypothetical protein
MSLFFFLHKFSFETSIDIECSLNFFYFFIITQYNVDAHSPL